MDDEDQKSANLQHLFLNPMELTDYQMEAVRKIAKVVMRDYKCDYTRAILVAYVEVFEMLEMDKTIH